MSNFEENFNVLKQIADEMASNELSLDDLLIKGELAQNTAKNCLKILKEHKGKFTKLETELQKITSDINKFTDEDNTNG